jgi:hypothetical protein
VAAAAEFFCGIFSNFFHTPQNPIKELLSRHIPENSRETLVRYIGEFEAELPESIAKARDLK